MSTIILSLRKENLGVSIDHGIVARIQGFPANSKEGDLPYFNEVVIPARREGGLNVDIAPGRYRVQAILPSGEILQEERLVMDGETASIAFSTGPASREWLSWQKFEGTLFEGALKVRPDAPILTAKTRAAVAPPPERRRRFTDVLKGLPVFRDLLGGKPDAAAEIDAAREFPDTWRGVRNAAALSMCEQPADAGKLSWSTVANAVQAVDVARIWNPEDPSSQVRKSRAQQDGNLSLWKLESDSSWEASTRFWSFSDVADVVEIGSIPLPWGDDLTSSSVEVLVDSSDGDVGTRTSIIVRDTVLGGMLAYLGRGRLSNSRPLIDSLSRDNLIHRTIQGKRKNPLAACAAAYVGLSIFEPGDAERWDGWLPNIMNEFPGIPDGAIVHARRMILRPGSPAETDAAFAALKEAYRRGIPYFTAGVLGLRDSLIMFRDKDKEAKEMLENVSRVATRLDTGQAFTVLSFPKM